MTTFPSDTHTHMLSLFALSAFLRKKYRLTSGFTVNDKVSLRYFANNTEKAKDDNICV